jgi:hypothetical protein
VISVHIQITITVAMTEIAVSRRCCVPKLRYRCNFSYAFFVQVHPLKGVKGRGGQWLLSKFGIRALR